MQGDKLSVQSSIILGAFIIAVAILISSGFKAKSPQAVVAGAQAQVPQKIEVDPVTEADHIRGGKQPKVIIIEYSDLECPFCKTFHQTVKQVASEYGDQVAWVYRHFPLDQIHSKARKEAEASECASEQGKFWEYIDELFRITPANNKLEESKLPEIAKTVGLNVTQFNSCLSSGKYATKVEEHAKSGANAGAQGTPYTLLVYGKGVKKLEGGAVSAPVLKSQIDALLAETK